GGWDLAGSLPVFEQDIADARAGSDREGSGEPKGKEVANGPSFDIRGKTLTAEALASAQVLKCDDPQGTSRYAWVTREGPAILLWSRQGALLNAVDSGTGHSMEPGLGASMLNPIDLLSGFAEEKLLGHAAEAVSGGAEKLAAELAPEAEGAVGTM